VEFIRESRLEDFINGNGETIIVSTIHKAKGKEFDNVFLMLNGFNPNTDEARRQLYVAMTRAKQNLTIHLNSNFLDKLTAENLDQIDDRTIYPPPTELAMQLIHEHVQLGYFEFIQRRVNNLLSGELLRVKEEGCANSRDELVLKFSKRFLEILEKQEKPGYKPKSAKVNHIVYWKNEEMEKEVKIVLPELSFEKLNGK
jgi:ATP-dependent DNA helicase RecQ